MGHSFYYKIFRQFIPIGFFTLNRKYLRPLFHKEKPPIFSGNYSSWAEAEKHTTGYDAANILEKVKTATLTVINGEAAFERDSVLFYKTEYSWPLLASLLKISSHYKNTLSVLDFGGALGSMYFQNRSFLSSLDSLEWSVVEQKNYVDCGNASIRNNMLKFYDTIDMVLKERRPNVLLLANVLQYIEDPHSLLKHILAYDFDYILFESTAFIEAADDRITVQNVPEVIYKASYPAWFFNEKKFLSVLQDKYQLQFDFYSTVNPPELMEGKNVSWKGFLFKRKANTN